MTNPDRLSPQETDDGAQSLSDMRQQPRFALLLRQAKLIGNGREYLCIVRDVSATGVKLRLFHPLPEGIAFALEMTSGERFAAVKVWEQEGEAGFRFVPPVDPARFIAETGPFPKRPVRLRVDHPATIHFGAQDYPAMIRDLSRQGAGIETEQVLAIGQKLRLSASQLPSFDATVCWRRHPAYGPVFEQLLSLEQLALRTSRMEVTATGSDEDAS